MVFVVKWLLFALNNSTVMKKAMQSDDDRVLQGGYSPAIFFVNGTKIPLFSAASIIVEPSLTVTSELLIFKLIIADRQPYIFCE